MTGGGLCRCILHFELGLIAFIYRLKNTHAHWWECDTDVNATMGQVIESQATNRPVVTPSLPRALSLSICFNCCEASLEALDRISHGWKWSWMDRSRYFSPSVTPDIFISASIQGSVLLLKRSLVLNTTSCLIDFNVARAFTTRDLKRWHRKVKNFFFEKFCQLFFFSSRFNSTSTD